MNQFTKEWYEQYIAKTGRKRKDTVVQKLQDDIKGKVDHKPKETGKNGRDHPRYSLTVKFYISDKRVRDLDGMLATICDCITRASARRRFLALRSSDSPFRRTMSERSRQS